MKELACSSGQSKNEADSAWYCLYSRRKQEHVAAARVRLLGSIPVFCPRIRFRRQTKGGATVMVTEAMFPGYFFARFSLGEMLPQVRSAHGVSSIVRFGDWYPVIDDDVIEQLRDKTGGDAVAELLPGFAPGDWVRLTEGPLSGLEAVITQVLPGKERVRVLLEFLGRETVTEARTDQVIPCDFEATLSRFVTVPVPALV
ncbi:MAG: KOW motif-containing protein [Verrucomicrobia bacterium]|nr:KOW motif-containing protein [Verrucomicrobiota bacterium]